MSLPDNDQSLKQLCAALLSLQDSDECRAFLEDLCTVAEIRSLAQRLDVARMVREGFTYQQIEQVTGASTATISRVKRFLYHGAGGYRRILERLEEGKG